MAHFVLRSSISRLAALPVRLGKQVGPLSSPRVAAVCQIQVEGLRATYGEPFGYEKPYPYEKKKLNDITEWFDNTHKRLNENSKIIIVEGNVALGKNDFANRLAKNFDMKVFNSVPDDKCFMVRNSTLDLRSFNDMLPDSWRQYDLKDFLLDPHPEKGTVGKLQLRWYEQRFYQYCEAMEHLLNTGQGVIVVKSAYGDLAMVEALRKLGYLSRNFMKYYTLWRDSALVEVLKPHLTIYLDAPNNIIMDRIKKRGNPAELNCKFLNEEFVETVRWAHEERFLDQMRISGEVMEIDWSEVGDDMDMEVIAEEMTRLDLEPIDNENPKFHDWWNLSEDDLAAFRKCLGNYDKQWTLFQHPVPWECPELLPDYEVCDVVYEILERHPAMTTQTGWAREFGHNPYFRL